MFRSRPSTPESQGTTLQEANFTKSRTSKLFLKYGLSSLFAISLLALLVFAGFNYFADPISSASKGPLVSASVKSTSADIASNIADLSAKPPLEFLSKFRHRPVVVAGVVLFALVTFAVIITLVLVTMKSGTPTLGGDEIRGGDLVVGNDEPSTQIATDEETFLQKYWYVGVSAGLIILFIVIAILKYLVPLKKETHTIPLVEKSGPSLEEDHFEEENREFFSSPQPQDFSFDRVTMKEVGKGSTSYVYKIYFGDIPLALKCMKEDYYHLLENEVAILRKIGGHQNIIRGPVYVKAPNKDDDESVSDDDDDEGCEMALEFFPHTLDHFYRNHLHVPDDEPILAYIAFCVLNGLVHIHSRNIVHKDIKPLNLGVTNQGVVKIFDFGTAKEYPEKYTCMKTLTNEHLEDGLYGQGSGVFIAPEVFLRCQLNSVDVTGKADIYSLGMTLLSLITEPWMVYGFESIKEVDYLGLYRKAEGKDLDRLLKIGTTIPGVSPEFKDFLRKCLFNDQSERSSAASLLGEPFLKGRCQREDILKRLPKVI